MKLKLLLLLSIFLMTACVETREVTYMSKYQKKVQRKFTKRQLSGDTACSRKVRLGQIGSYNDKTVTRATRKGLIQNRRRGPL